MTITARSIARLGGALVGALTIGSLTGLPSGSSVASAASAGKGKGWGIVVAPAEVSPILPPVTRTTIPAPSYADVIARVENMPNDQNLLDRARRFGLDVVNLTWEDTGRYEGSSVGPNISDLTLQVREPLGAGQDRTHLLPVVRYPNYSDKTGDIAMNKIWIKVGNQSNRSQPVAVPLSEVLSNMRAYLSNPSSLNGKGNFLAKRDSHVLTSAQHVFMPLPAAGKVEFTPVLYNYQSSQGNPAVLTLMVTREGTSATIIENAVQNSGSATGGDQSYQSWGQQLYFNNKGQRTTFTAERKSAVKARIDSGQATTGDAGALDEGSDMVMVIQVPLVHQVSYPEPNMDLAPAPAAAAPAPGANQAKDKQSSAVAGSVVQERSDVEQAVIGHGSDKGPFAEMSNMNLVRDTQFPIRVTVQFYKATSNGVVSDADLKAMHDEIGQVYSNADYVGSLVVPNGDRTRPTAWTRGRTPLR
jgi:hypothetical protein